MWLQLKLISRRIVDSCRSYRTQPYCLRSLLFNWNRRVNRAILGYVSKGEDRLVVIGLHKDYGCGYSDTHRPAAFAL